MHTDTDTDTDTRISCGKSRGRSQKHQQQQKQLVDDKSYSFLKDSLNRVELRLSGVNCLLRDAFACLICTFANDRTKVRQGVCVRCVATFTTSSRHHLAIWLLSLPSFPPARAWAAREEWESFLSKANIYHSTRWVVLPTTRKYWWCKLIQTKLNRSNCLFLRCVHVAAANLLLICWCASSRLYTFTPEMSLKCKHIILLRSDSFHSIPFFSIATRIFQEERERESIFKIDLS